MVNGRLLQDELQRIGDFFENLSIEELEKIAFDCGAGVIEPSYSSSYIIPCKVKNKYSNKENRISNCTDNSKFTIKDNKEGLEAA